MFFAPRQGRARDSPRAPTSVMIYALSTHWNAYRHSSGEALVEEILRAGFGQMELGYDLRPDLAPGVREMVRRGAISVSSVHNFCPVPVGAPHGHPELFTFASLDPEVRARAIHHTRRTIEFASELGAPCVVAHAGNVEMRNLTHKLVALYECGRQFDRRYERIKLKLLMRREKKIARQLEALDQSLVALLPALESARVRLALENLPSWEGIPSEAETEAICRKFQSPWIGYWHDIGHGQVRQNLGFISQRHWVEKLSPWLAGMHIHDVVPPAQDHLMPPDGNVDFAAFSGLVHDRLALVFEPAPGMPIEKIREGLRIVRAAWDRQGAAEG